MEQRKRTAIRIAEPVLGATAAGVAYGIMGRGYKVAIIGASIVVFIAIGVIRRNSAPGDHERSPLRWLPAAVPLLLALIVDSEPAWVVSFIPDPGRRWPLALGLLLVAILAATLVCLGIDVRFAIARGVRAVTSAVRSLFAILLYLLLLLPLGIARVWRRSDPLGTGRGRLAGSAWHSSAAGPSRLAWRTYRVEEPGSGTHPLRAALGAVPRVLGVVILLLAADFGIGWGWNRVSPDTPPWRLQTATGKIEIHSPAGATAGGIRIDTPLDPLYLDAADAQDYPPDPREELPAMRKYTWRHDYFQELQRAWTTYWPYLMFRPLPVTGRYLNISGWDRRSYQAGATGSAMPDVSLFGGSTIYGEGQRDEHTIASELARMAEADGIPIRIHNHGVRGWVNWQEMLAFEQLSADPKLKSDIAVFYDGANEAAAQAYSVQGVPSHSSLDDIAKSLSGGNALVRNPETARADDPGFFGCLQLLGRAYRETSAVARAGRWVSRTLGGDPAGASTGQGEPDLDAVSPIYRRGRALIQSIANRQGVDTVFFWQPLQNGGWERYTEGIDDPTIDISRALIGRDDVFIDGTHTNEDGALIAAQAMWPHLKPTVEKWYREHR